MATLHALTLKPVSEESSKMGARVFRNQEKLLRLFTLLGTGALEVPGWKPPQMTLETVSDAEGPETVLAWNQQQLLVVILAILQKQDIPEVSLKMHLMECGQAAENDKTILANLLKYAGQKVPQSEWNVPMHHPMSMTHYAYIMHNQCVMLNTIHAKNPDLFVVIKREDQCCCAVQ